MQSALTLLVCSLAAFASAAPQAKGKSHLVTFDKLTVTPGTAVLNKPPTPYLGLNYSGIALQSNKLGAVSEFNPESGHNTAFYGVETNTLDNSNAFVEVANKDTYLSLESFYFLCTINLGAVILPTDCTTIVSATDVNGKARSTTFKYHRNGKKMQKVVLPHQFRKIKSFGLVTTTGDVVDDTTLSGTFDNMEYTIYKK